MLVKAKTGFRLPFLYYPNLSLSKVLVFFYIKAMCVFFLSYIVTNEIYKPVWWKQELFPVSFCSVSQCLKSHLSFVPLCEFCLCCACRDCSAIPSEGQKQPKHPVNQSIVHLPCL